MSVAPVPSFSRHGAADPVSPVVLSVPHAGRDYPPSLRAALRVPAAALLPLEDRHMDAVALAALAGETCFVAQRARAWIDLNRSESDRDPRVDDGAHPRLLPFVSAKVRSGLGLVPRRVNGAGDLWRRRWSGEEIAARIAGDHRPYHGALAAALAAARARFGVAVLLDLHSMPPIPGTGAARLVIGDRFGRAASTRLVARVEMAARESGWPTALNAPYPGGHILERHAAPARGIHAVQIEIDRAAYLDTALTEPGPGFDRTVALVRGIIDAVADELLPTALAAE